MSPQSRSSRARLRFVPVTITTLLPPLPRRSSYPLYSPPTAGWDYLSQPLPRPASNQRWGWCADGAVAVPLVRTDYFDRTANDFTASAPPGLRRGPSWNGPAPGGSRLVPLGAVRGRRTVLRGGPAQPATPVPGHRDRLDLRVGGRRRRVETAVAGRQARRPGDRPYPGGPARREAPDRGRVLRRPRRWGTV